MGVGLKRIRNTDFFTAGNLLLFIGYCLLALFGGRGAIGSLAEFGIYATSIFALIALSWYFLQDRPCPTSLLLVIELGLLAHFAGAFVPIDGGRLYEAEVLGMRFDKYVHLLNAFAGGALINHFLQPGLKARPLIVAGLLLGAGTIVEIVEYLAFLAVADAGVGGYENNMQDLAMNLVGVSLFLAFRIAAHRRAEMSIADSSVLREAASAHAGALPGCIPMSSRQTDEPLP